MIRIQQLTNLYLDIRAIDKIVDMFWLLIEDLNSEQLTKKGLMVVLRQYIHILEEKKKELEELKDIFSNYDNTRIKKVNCE